MRKTRIILGALLAVPFLASCSFHFGPEKDAEHSEVERQQGALVKQGAAKIRAHGALPESTDAVKVDALAATLAQSLGAPAAPVDFENNAQVAAVNAELDRKSKEFAEKEAAYQKRIAAIDNTLGTAEAWLGIGGTVITGLGIAAAFLAKGRAVFKTFAQAQVVGTSQLKATYDHARVQLTELAKTDKDAALQGALDLLHRDAINPILKNGAEAVGGSTGLETMLSTLKDGIEQGLLNRPLIAADILIHNNRTA